MKYRSHIILNTFQLIRNLLFLFLLFLAFYVSAQTDETILTIGNNKISKSEFERIYKKNNSNLYNESDKKSPSEYMKMYIDFKLKVLEAQALKMDTFSTFINEFNKYRNELARPYLTDIQFSEQLVKKMYDRMTKEINASHILFTLSEDAPESKVDSVFTKALKVKDEILAGKSFHEAAREVSDDPSAKINGGNLGYFSAFQMVTPFEDAVYNTPAGKISEPVRTNFGVHLISVHDIRPNRGEIRVAHIMKMFPRNGIPFDKLALKVQIDSVFRALKNGADFSEMAKKYSDDKQSAAQGGEMPWFSSGRMIPEFSEPAFKIIHVGDFTEPVETPFGYHIIKKLEEKPVKPFEELKSEIEELIKRDPSRSISSKKSFVNKLKNEYNFKEVTETLKNLSNLDISNPVEDPNLVLFTLDNKNYTIKSFNDYLINKGIIKGNYHDYSEEWIENEITSLEDSKLENKYPEFKYLMKEYHDGMLLFNISEEKIWNYAAMDSVNLVKFYEKNKGKYTWGERFKGFIISCKDSLVREEAEKFLSQGIRPGEIKSVINKEEEKISITEGAWEKGSNGVIDYYTWNGIKPENFDERLTFIQGNKIPPEPKTLNDARGMYISDYQNYIEKEWLKVLHKKYKIRVNKKLLNSIKGV